MISVSLHALLEPVVDAIAPSYILGLDEKRTRTDGASQALCESVGLARACCRKGRYAARTLGWRLQETPAL